MHKCSLELPISSHRMLKRCVLKGQDLLKLMIFTASSRTVSEREVGIFVLLRGGRRRDYH